MKHLRKFNESVGFGFQLQKFCNDYLSYLIDKGFSVEVKDGTIPSGRCKVIMIGKERDRSTQFWFDWKEVEDDFIPFYTLLKTKYELLPFADKNRVLTDKTILLYDRDGEHPIADSDIGNLNLFYDRLYYIKLLVNV